MLLPLCGLFWSSLFLFWLEKADKRPSQVPPKRGLSFASLFSQEAFMPVLFPHLYKVKLRSLAESLKHRRAFSQSSVQFAPLATDLCRAFARADYDGVVRGCCVSSGTRPVLSGNGHDTGG